MMKKNEMVKSMENANVETVNASESTVLKTGQTAGQTAAKEENAKEEKKSDLLASILTLTTTPKGLTKVTFKNPAVTVTTLTEGNETRTAHNYTWSDEHKLTLPKIVENGKEEVFARQILFAALADQKKACENGLKKLKDLDPDKKTDAINQTIKDIEKLLPMVDAGLSTLAEVGITMASPLATLCAFAAKNGKMSIDLSLFQWANTTAKLAGNAYDKLLSLFNGDTVNLNNIQLKTLATSKEQLKDALSTYTTAYDGLYESFKLSVSNKDLVDFVFFANPRKNEKTGEFSTRFRATLTTGIVKNNLKLYIVKWYLRKMRSEVLA